MKKDQMVGTRLSPELVQGLEQIERAEHSDRSSTVRKLLAKAIVQWRLDHSVDMYSQGLVTMERAAEDAHTTVWRMMEYIRERRVPSQYDLEEWQQDLASIAGRLIK